MARGIEQQLAALDHRLALAAAARQLAAAQQRADALDQQALRERLLDVVVGAHAQAQHLVDLVVLGGEEDHRHGALLPELAEQLHAVHARHLDVEDGEVGGMLGEPAQRLGAVGVGAHLETLGLERDRH